MQTLNATGRAAGTTRDEPDPHNTDGCAWCPRAADGVDATTSLPVCQGCADALDTTAGTRLVTAGGESA